MMILSRAPDGEAGHVAPWLYLSIVLAAGGSAFPVEFVPAAGSGTLAQCVPTS